MADVKVPKKDTVNFIKKKTNNFNRNSRYQDRFIFETREHMLRTANALKFKTQSDVSEISDFLSKEHYMYW